jgi:hypothetical protein
MILLRDGFAFAQSPIAQPPAATSNPRYSPCSTRRADDERTAIRADIYMRVTARIIADLDRLMVLKNDNVRSLLPPRMPSARSIIVRVTAIRGNVARGRLKIRWGLRPRHSMPQQIASAEMSELIADYSKA